MLQSFRSILRTDIYLLVKHNLHIQFVLAISAIKNYVTVDEKDVVD